MINSPTDLGVNRRLQHLHELQAKARAANRRLLDTERAGQGCVLASPAFARVAQPTTGEAGYSTGALRFGDPRVMALAGALCLLLARTVGFTHRSLRAQVTALLGVAYSASQMSYDLTRLRRKGLIQRLPHTNTYVLTGEGVRFALFYTKVHDRLLIPLLAANTPPASPQLRQALGVIDRSVGDYVPQRWPGGCMKPWRTRKHQGSLGPPRQRGTRPRWRPDHAGGVIGSRGSGVGVAGAMR